MTLAFHYCRHIWSLTLSVVIVEQLLQNQGCWLTSSATSLVVPTTFPPCVSYIFHYLSKVVAYRFFLHIWLWSNSSRRCNTRWLWLLFCTIQIHLLAYLLGGFLATLYKPSVEVTHNHFSKNFSQPWYMCNGGEALDLDNFCLAPQLNVCSQPYGNFIKFPVHASFWAMVGHHSGCWGLVFLLWRWTSICDLSLRILPRWCQDEPVCQMSSSEVIYLRRYCPET